MALVGRLIEADAVGTRGCTHATGLLVWVKVETANQIDGFIVKVLEVVDRSLLRSATQDAGKGRGGAPDRLHPGVVVLTAFKT